MATETKPAFTAERRERILELLRAHGVMALRDIACDVRASEVTVRRDVRCLEADGLLDRRRGGAALPRRHSQDRTHPQSGQATPEKLAIAAAAARLVEDGDTIALGPGSTTEALARELVERQDLTVVTNSLPVAEVLATAPGIDVVMTGGTLHASTLGLVGTAAEQSLAGLRVRRTFISGHGVTADRGLSTPNQAMGSTDRALANCAQETIVLASHATIGTDTMVRTMPPELIAHLITDNHADPEVLMTLEDMGTLVHVVVLEVDRGE